MYINDWTLAHNKLLNVNDKMEIISGNQVTVCKFQFEEATELAPHSHENEQVTIVIEGKIIIEYSEMIKNLEAGEGCIIPSNVVHTVRITEAPFRSYDIFSPIRKDFLGTVVG